MSNIVFCRLAMGKGPLEILSLAGAGGVGQCLSKREKGIGVFCFADYHHYLVKDCDQVSAHPWPEGKLYIF
ncbi:hypothetical protein X474_06310 [Dethiosulfatarculus sandiegensis]|uniref:Uncharacterized protein n=1 Tax=Dethiosulfatarculus sandiegensis TaxID=1429043 RepID=A0A0D2JG90_9BACT|nr:hypothetical protein X474_06310 [Dethiosulfatarculus sandiegensis]